MNSFAFINHPLSTQQFQSLELRLLKMLPKEVIEWGIKVAPPFQYLKIGPVSSTSGASIVGTGIICPWLPKHFVSQKEDQVLAKIREAILLGSRCGATLIGLGGFTSIPGSGGLRLAQETGIPLTSGNSYTAYLAIQGIRKAASLLGRELETSTLTVLGATGDIGSICSRVLAREVHKIILVARSDPRLEKLKQDLEVGTGAKVEIMKRSQAAARQSHIVLCVTSSLTTLLGDEDLLPGTIVCDVAYPANIMREVALRRTDVFLFEGGIATFSGWHQLPISQRKKLALFCPEGTMHGCLAETLILSFENIRRSYSVGRGQITERQLEEIGILGERHGFSLAPFFCGGSKYEERDFLKLREVACSQA